VVEDPVRDGLLRGVREGGFADVHDQGSKAGATIFEVLERFRTTWRSDLGLSGAIFHCSLSAERAAAAYASLARFSFSFSSIRLEL
jgi:hypothetical protein